MDVQLTPLCFTVRESVKLAAEYTQAAIENAFPLGSGHGPLNHLHNIQQRPVPLYAQSRLWWKMY